MTAAITSDTARLPIMLTQLRLPTVARLWPTISETADRDGWPAARTLAALLEHEIAERAQRRIARHLLEARLPGWRCRLLELPRGGLATWPTRSAPVSVSSEALPVVRTARVCRAAGTASGTMAFVYRGPAF